MGRLQGPGVYALSQENSCYSTLVGYCVFYQRMEPMFARVAHFTEVTKMCWIFVRYACEVIIIIIIKRKQSVWFSE